MRRVLLVDLAPQSGIARRLAGILETSFTVDVSGRAVGASAEVVVICGSHTRIEQIVGAVASLRRASPGTPIIAALDSASARDIFELLEGGISDFLSPPFPGDEIRLRVGRVAATPQLPATAMEEARNSLFLRQLVGESPAFLSEVGKISFVARCDAAVLITGETGVGKELVARAIHYLSRRAAGAFVPVNCGAIPGELFENELFGHEAGAFTGAAAAQPGLIEESDGGTLFLDEADSLSPAAQVKLLRFLQEKEYRRLGSTKVRRADIRVVAAMNTCPEEAVKSGRMRQDLYYRLNVVPLALPPLRDRREDIPRLAAWFLERHAGGMKKPVTGFSPAAMERLVGYSWPGNVRELEHVVERAVIFARGATLEAGDMALPETAGAFEPESFQKLKARVIAQFEKSYITALLAAHRGNISSAARAARKNRRAFFQLMRKHGIHGQGFRTETA